MVEGSSELSSPGILAKTAFALGLEKVFKKEPVLVSELDAECMESFEGGR